MTVGVTRVGLDGWLARIRDREMPVFGRTVQELQTVVASERSSAGALAQVILQDAAMTAKVLKLANSACFNPGRQTVSTVSRAIVVLGFDLVAQIAFSLALIDTLLAGGRRDRVTQLMASSFHAAVQARAAARARHDHSPEEVFIAALLAQIGEMAFWCFGGEAGDALDAAMGAPGVTAEEAQQNVLGFRLRQLTTVLAQEWKLGSLVRSVAERGTPQGPREQCIVLAWRLARAAERGWDSPEARTALKDFGAYLGEPAEDVLPRVAENAQDAARIASLYGAREAAALIPLPPSAAALETLLEPIEASKPDTQLQLRILRDLSLMIATRPNVNDLLQMVLEGIYRGVGMDRALFALLNPDRSRLVAKTALGRDSGALASRFSFPLSAVSNLVTTAIAEGKTYFITAEADPKLLHLARHIFEAAATSSFMIAPIAAGGRTIGAYYADRGVSGAAITEEDYESFLHFVQQANLGLDLAAARSHRG